MMMVDSGRKGFNIHKQHIMGMMKIVNLRVNILFMMREIISNIL